MRNLPLFEQMAAMEDHPNNEELKGQLKECITKVCTAV
jgi:hypothetical protein